MQGFRAVAAGVAGISAMVFGGTAQAQRLDDNLCNNALYHYEDATHSPAHLSTLLVADTRTYCDASEGTRTCLTGQEVYDNYVRDLRRYNITRIDITRMALFPELIGSTQAACASHGDGTHTLGLIVNRHFHTQDDIFDEVVIAFRFRPRSDGAIDILSWEIFGPGNIPKEALGVNPWSRRNFLFDRNYGSRRTVFAQGADESRGQAIRQSGQGGSAQARSGGGSTTITRSGYALASSSTSASSQAERNARNNAIGACRTRGGSPGRVTTRPTGTRQATSASYSANYEATVICNGL